MRCADPSATPDTCFHFLVVRFGRVRFLPTTLLVQVKLCVSVCVRAITLELFTVDLVCWSILTLYKSGVKVKVTSHFSHKQVLNYPEHVLYHFRNARLFWLQPRRAIHISNNCYLNLVENDVF